MRELTDLEICQNIAKIEKLNQVEIRGNVLVSHGFICDRIYNPLTDDALCFQLMVKYGVEIIPSWDRVGINNGKITIANYNDSPSRAICLAIIEAHKEK